jgi:hypothetical protein
VARGRHGHADARPVPPFAAFATGGLETELQTCRVTATSALTVCGIRRERPSAVVSAGIGHNRRARNADPDGFRGHRGAGDCAVCVVLRRSHGWRKLSALAPAV